MLKRVNHVGIVVDDLATAKEFLSKILNLDLRREISLPENALTAAFFRCGDVDIEVIEIQDPEARNKRLGNGPARVEHIAIEVDSLEQTLTELRERGVQIASGPRRVGSNVSAWSDPTTTDGVIYQFIELG